MATTVSTSTSTTPTKGRRMVAVDSSGRTWVALYSLANTRYEFWYSDDDGATWTENTAARIGSIVTSPNCASFFIDVNDRAFFAYHRPAVNTSLRWMADIDASTSWANAVTVDSDECLSVDVVAFPMPGAPTLTVVAIAIVEDDSTNDNIVVYTARINESNNYVSGSAYTIDVDAGNAAQGVALDFRHTGDGKTVASGQPDLYLLANDEDAGVLKFSRLVWSSGTTYGGLSYRTIDASSYASSGRLSGVFDGTRFVMAYVDSGSTSTIKVAERDAADTTTTTRTPPALSDGEVTALSVGFDGESDIRLYAVGTTSDDVKRVTYDRSANSWGSWETIEAATALADTLSCQRSYRGSGIEVVWSTGGSSPYDIDFERDAFNRAPTAATWVSPSNNAAADVAESLVLDWDFNDPDDGDTQSAYALERVVNGGSAEYYNAGTTSWGGTETKNTSTTSAVTLASSWASDGDSVVYKVKTWDATDTEGVYSSGLTIRGSAKVNPSLTAPTDAGTITGNKVTATWTVSEQTAYRVRVLTSGDAQLYDSGKVTSTATTVQVPYVLTDGVTYKVEVRTWNADDLESDTDTHTFDVDFVEPAQPTYVKTADPTNARVALAITDPAPTGSQPTVDHHDVFVRVAEGGRPDGERPVGGDGIRIATGIESNSTWYDRAAGSRHVYEYRTLAVATNGTSIYGEWT